MSSDYIIILSVLIFILAIAIKPIRKAIGLVLIIAGIFECLSIIGILIGLFSILIGGIFLYA